MIEPITLLTWAKRLQTLKAKTRLKRQSPGGFTGKNIESREPSPSSRLEALGKLPSPHKLAPPLLPKIEPKKPDRIDNNRITEYGVLVCVKDCWCSQCQGQVAIYMTSVGERTLCLRCGKQTLSVRSRAERSTSSLYIDSRFNENASLYGA